MDRRRFLSASSLMLAGFAAGGGALAGAAGAPAVRLRAGVLRKKFPLIAMTNKTGFDHPIHLHGHFFRVLSINGEKLKQEVWRDTVMLTPWSDAVIALVAEEPGDWMFHCHVLEHSAAGMMAVVRVE